MRPLELTIEGFRSYRHRVTFDFRGRRLVGVVGPIGSGKSSILDAISFALFGKTPLVERDTKTLIHQLGEQCHVELRFEVEGEVWCAVRALRRKGQAGHKLVSLAGDEAAAEVLKTFTGEKGVNEQIALLLGMDFKAFCRSVLLAQNRFSEFLHSTPADRDKVLKSVFGYERLDAAYAAARVRLSVAEFELGALDKELERIGEARAELQDAEAAASAALARWKELGAATNRVEKLERERTDADALAEASAAGSRSLAELAERLPAREEVDRVVGEKAAATEVIAAAKATLERAQLDRAAREAELADLMARLGDPERFRSFELLVRKQEEEAAAAERARIEVERIEAGSAQALATAAARQRSAVEAAIKVLSADEQVAEASQRLAGAREALLHAQHSEMSQVLRGTLEAGKPCPVCMQAVRTLPRGGPAPRVAASKKALASAEKAESKSRGTREDAVTAEASAVAGAAEAAATAARSSAELKDAALRLEAAVAAQTATQGQLAEWLGEGDARTLLEAREGEVAAAREALEAAKAAIDPARSAFDAAREGADLAAAALAELAGRLAGAWGRLGRDRTVASEPSAVASAYIELGETIVEGRAQAQAALEAAMGRAAELDAASAALLHELALPPGQDFRAALTEAEVQQRTEASRVVDLKERISRAGSLSSQVRQAQARRSLAQRLSEDLRPSRFLAFLLEEERAELAELGSDHLELLTAGGYRFAQNDSFDIADLNAAGSVRKAASLSGGETFLASLALALALAQMVARGAGRLEAFFLDEGFGSLDPEHLDRAMEGIGRLVAGDERRLVVLVSHVAEMREAIEDLVVLEKNGVTGDSIVSSGASPVV